MKSVDTNAGGTSGYTIKAGKNSGKVLGHIKKEIKKIQSQWGMGHLATERPLFYEDGLNIKHNPLLQNLFFVFVGPSLKT